MSYILEQIHIFEEFEEVFMPCPSLVKVFHKYRIGASVNL
jgi:hypothetical protein